MIDIYNQLTFHERKVLICLRESKPKIQLSVLKFFGRVRTYI